MLANKVNQRQQKQKELIQISTAAMSTTTQTSSTTAVAAGQPLKVNASNAISALVNNPILQNTPVKVGQTTIKPYTPQQQPQLLEKKPLLDSVPPPLAPLSGSNVAKDACGRPVIIANQMLVDILDKKAIEPPITGSSKRKLDETSNEPCKRMTMDAAVAGGTTTEQVTPSKNAANLYAEMAASILEDEDLEELEEEEQ